MNPNTPQPNFELPSPVPHGAEQQGVGPQEQQAASAESAMRPLQPPLTSMQQLSSPMPQAAPLMNPVPSVPVVDMPSIADDSDLIEKEWVEKAKQIVAATRENPHEQNKQMSRVKAEYLKKRYNKDIKIEES